MKFCLIALTTCFVLLAAHTRVCTLAQERQSDTPIKVQATLVNIPVIVSDRQGRYISGLQVSDFTLYKDRVKQTIAVFDSVEEPLNVALLLDTSKSTQDVLSKIRDAAKNFLKELRPQDRAMIVAFDCQVHVLSPLTSDRKALERAIKKADVGEFVGTTMRDAVAKVIGESFKEIKGRKAIILLTDGKDHGSAVSEDTLLESAAESDAMIYSIFYNTGFATRYFPRERRGSWRRRGGVFDRFPRQRRAPDDPRRRDRMERNNELAAEYLEELSEASAGRFYQSGVTDLKKTFDLIADELRHQYRLGFYANDDKPNGSSHGLSVEVARSDAVVRSRRSYQSRASE